MDRILNAVIVFSGTTEAPPGLFDLEMILQKLGIEYIMPLGNEGPVLLKFKTQEKPA